MLRAALDAVDAGLLVQRALDQPDLVAPLQRASAVDVIAAGKAARVMLAAFAAGSSVPVRTMVGIGPPAVALSGGGVPTPLPAGAQWHDAGHPLPTEGSVRAAARALQVAAAATPTDLLLVLLSGGGSSLMALPAPGISLREKQATGRTLMEQGADIYELNTVRKHLSAIKGGHLAAASPASVLTLAVSDVVGDDLSVIASGPTVPDRSTFGEALAVLQRRGGQSCYPPAVVDRLHAGATGAVPETPKRGDPRLARTHAIVIGPQRGAIESARATAASLGYHVHVVPDPITGEARHAGRAHVTRLAPLVTSHPRPLCVISAGETTVTVTGTGRGGRNQEFAFAMAESLQTFPAEAVAASIGTDGIDGPTDAAGALADPTTFARAREQGLRAPHTYLDDNNTYAFFDALGDLVRTGPTSTNVGDLQVVLIG